MTINSQAKGKRAELAVANWFKVNGYPDAGRAVKTGTTYTHDGGDLILEHGDFRLCVEVKHRAGGLSDSEVLQFGRKLQQQIVMSKSDMGILVERRDRVGDPGRWWVHMHSSALATLEVWALRNGSAGLVFGAVADFRPVRLQLDYLATLLQKVGLAQPPEAVPSSAASAYRMGADTKPERAQAVGGT
jgi:Holliday junction resolvase-like predicted endonuclease